MRVVVLRLGHRPERDKRVTTHVGLVARAFGASGMILTTPDDKVVESIRKVVENWGGNFFVEVEPEWRRVIREWRGTRVHLTMYGEHVDEKIGEIRSSGKDVLVVVGAEKVPAEVFQLVDYNIAIGHQPHSEVAALAVFLDRLFEGEELHRSFEGRMRVVPSTRGKRVVQR
ncbi:MAG: tRNA (cytidine(56)-2'-O)-methyltransferase [Euryarchaeota archaeon]|nr:tRNA (cytidine(56)-2'-O)-methyltransferase [Euryarchaeota archaeon]